MKSPRFNSSCLILVINSFIWILKCLWSTAVAWPWLSEASYGFWSISDQQQLLYFGYHKLHMDIGVSDQQQLLDLGCHRLHIDFEVSQINSSCLTLFIKLHMVIEESQIRAVAWPWLSYASYGFWRVSDQQQWLALVIICFIWTLKSLWSTAVAWPWLYSYIWTLKCLWSSAVSWHWLSKATYWNWRVTDHQ